MKIMAYADGAPTTGLGRVGNNFFNDLSDRGHEIVLAGFNFMGRDAYAEGVMRYKCVPAVRHPDICRDPVGASVAHKNMRLYCQANNFRPDIVFIFNDFFLFEHNAAEYRKLADDLGAKLVVYSSIDTPPRKEYLEIARLADAAITYLDWGVEQIAQVDPELAARMHTVGHGVDTVFYNPEKKRHAGLRRYLPKGKTKLVLTVGTHSPRKDMASAFQVMAQVIARCPEVFYVALTNPYDTRALGVNLDQLAQSLGMEFGKDVMWFHPDGAKLSDEELVQAYINADLGLLTSVGEGWSMTCDEMIACGTPVAHAWNSAVAARYSDEIVYALPCPHRRVIPGVFSLPVPVVDVPAATDVIVSALQDDEGRAQRSRLGRQYVERWKWKDCADKLETIFEGVIG